MPPLSFSLVARDISVTLGRTTVLDGVSLTVGPEHRVGVVGPNGAGKSTLLRVLAGEITPDSGTVSRSPSTLTVGYLPQEPSRRADETVLGFLGRRTGVAAASGGLDASSVALGAGAPDAGEAYSDSLERWLGLGAADFDARAEAVWADLGMGPDLLRRATATLSGGEAARASLAAVLLARFDVLLLDEPTNDLDFDGLERLESFLARVPGAVAVVSHDRAFLERTITSVLEIDERTHQGTLFAGGWTAYLEERATARRHADEAYAEYTRKRSHLTDRARTQRQWAVTGAKKTAKAPTDNDKAQRDWRLNRTEKLAAKVRIPEKALARLERDEHVEKPWQSWELRLSIAATDRSGDMVARLEGAVIERGEFRLGPVDVDVAWGERIAVLGPNGSGKSTLLAGLLGRIPLVAGSQRLGPSVVVGEIDQARMRFEATQPLLVAFTAAAGTSVKDARSLLAKFGLGADHVDRPAASLSPGERTRAVLALLMARGVNCLVLDEPTNHLDLPAIEQLEQALDTWEGTLLLVTHDRRLLENVRIDRTLGLDARGSLRS